MEKVIDVKNVSKRYKLFEDSKERFLSLFNKDKFGRDFYALNNIDFAAYEGDVVGFIGTNGSGKSTLSNIIAGIVPETTGEVYTRGQVSLIAVAAGLDNNLTGRENVELKCLMLGFNKQEILDLEPEIIEFSELGEFIDQPVKSYSSGMKSRLGFAISVSVDPDILIIDEALSVGDKAFAEKSLNKMKEFKAQGKTMIFVSHSIGQMKKFCDKILWLEFGRSKAYGEADEVLSLYESFLKKWQNMTKKDRDQYRENVVNSPVKKENIQSNDNIVVYSTADEFIEHSDDYEIQLESRLAHIRSGKSYIYEAPNKQKNYISADDYKNNVYYVKRSATFRFEKFYLLSEEPSGETGVIGWMKESDVKTHLTTFVDKDEKVLRLNGKGKAFSWPWGGKKQLVFSDLKDQKNETIHVKESWFIGSGTWYKGMLFDKEVWIHSKYTYN